MAAFDVNKFDRVLAVEGYSDLLFYAEMLEEVGNPGNVFIEDFNGKGDLAANLPIFITPVMLAEKIRIGVIADADEDPAGTFTQLENIMHSITGQHVAASGAWTNGHPKIGILVVPASTTVGEIETLVWNAWSSDAANSQAKECLEGFAQCMNAAGLEAHSPSKGLVSSLLAIRHDEDPRLGPGARANVFDLSRPQFAQLREFLSAYNTA